MQIPSWVALNMQKNVNKWCVSPTGLLQNVKNRRQDKEWGFSLYKTLRKHGPLKFATRIYKNVIKGFKITKMSL